MKKAPKGFSNKKPRVYEPTPEDLRIPLDEWEVIVYDKDRGVHMKVGVKDSKHPTELIDMFNYAGVEEGLEPDTIQGTAKQLSTGWTISWTADGGTVKDLEKKTGEKILVNGGLK
jgi:hypothetical protein